ncbi:MAG: hypothetical protein CLLPBCKN_006392 [Chroococcidiopsis cubana SAG 39.79]|nr:hypothetical protein [Chroococcidiopsis cubana SAG 39.79]
MGCASEYQIEAAARIGADSSIGDRRLIRRIGTGGGSRLASKGEQSLPMRPQSDCDAEGGSLRDHRAVGQNRRLDPSVQFDWD